MIDVLSLVGPLRAALRSRLGSNIISLYAVQGLNFLLPLLILPYLLRVLGPVNYGAIAFAQSLIGYAVILTDFGFNLSATRAISVAREQPEELARIFWSTTAAKCVLLLGSIVILTPAVALIPSLRAEWSIVAASGLLAIGSVVFPQWYFLGLERMRAVAVIYFITRLAALVAILFVVRSAADTLVAAIILSGQQVVAAIVSAIIIPFVIPVRRYRPTIRDIGAALAGSRHFFVSNAAGSMYLNSNVFLLGLFSGRYSVALYSLANKIALTLFGMMTPIVQAAYPRASVLFERSRSEARHFVKRLLLAMIPIAVMLAAGCYILAPEIVYVLGGKQYSQAVPVLRIMSVLPLVLTVASVMAQIVMINTGLARQLSRIYIALGILNLMLVPGLASWLQADGVAISLVIVEILGPILMMRSIRRTRAFHCADMAVSGGGP